MYDDGSGAGGGAHHFDMSDLFGQMGGMGGGGMGGGGMGGHPFFQMFMGGGMPGQGGGARG